MSFSDRHFSEAYNQGRLIIKENLVSYLDVAQKLRTVSYL